MKSRGLLRAFAVPITLVLLAISTAGAAGENQRAPLGASLSWTTFEAELATTDGKIMGPDFTGHTPAREASGRRCVVLSATGQHIEFKAASDAQGIVVRYSIPDSKEGVGEDATLSLLINGKSQTKLKLTSKLSYLYGSYPFKNDPAAGEARNFWDEAHVMPGTAIHAGDSIRLEKQPDDSAAEYRIDFVDLETVPAPIEMPADALSVMDFGATPNDPSDDRAAFITTIERAKAEKKSVWIPAGRFVIKGAIRVNTIAIHGAGMWYSTLTATDGEYTPANRVAIYGDGDNVALSDFAMVGNLNYRNDSEPNDGLGETFGGGSSIRNVWVEHTKAGAWLVNSDGLVVEGCRFRDTIADGINLCLGMKNCVVRNCSARGTGDDCFAIWPASYAKAAFAPGGNRFEHCTAQLPFLAQAFSIYGGDSNRVEACEAIDIPYGAGLYASTTFPTEVGFVGKTQFRNVKLVRAGAADGAIGTVANLIDLPGIAFEDIRIEDAPTDGIRFISMKGHRLLDAIFDRIQIVNAGVSGAGYAIAKAPGAAGSATVQNITATHSTSGGVLDGSKSFKLILGEGNQGFTSDDTKQADAGGR